MNLLEILNKEAWIKHVAARDANGEQVLYSNPKACKFCLQGAMLRGSMNGSDAGQNILHWVHLLDEAIFLMFKPRMGDAYVPCNIATIIQFNDHPDTTWEDVERVIKLAQSRDKNPPALTA